MAPRPFLVGLAVAGFLCAATARADQDPVAQARALSRLPQKPSDAVAVIGQAPAATFGTERAAALAFIDMVRKLPDQRMEYCAYILRGADGRFGFSPIRQGDTDQCPSNPFPPNAAAMVHTHPIWGDPNNLGANGQIFSEADYASSEWPQQPLPTYLGAPAGHVLRYVPGNTYHMGTTIVIRYFDIVRKPEVAGSLKIKSGQKNAWFDEGGNPKPMPSYAKDASATPLPGAASP